MTKVDIISGSWEQERQHSSKKLIEDVVSGKKDWS